jgi:hypothetical protein
MAQTIEIDGKQCPVMKQDFPCCIKHGRIVGVYAAGYAFQHCPKCHSEMKAKKAG